MNEGDREKLIALRQEWLARRRARLDQQQKQFEAQYDMMLPSVNKKRLEDLEVWKFEIEFHEWELDRFIRDGEEGWPT